MVGSSKDWVLPNVYYCWTQHKIHNYWFFVQNLKKRIHSWLFACERVPTYNVKTKPKYFKIHVYMCIEPESILYKL